MAQDLADAVAGNGMACPARGAAVSARRRPGRGIRRPRLPGPHVAALVPASRRLRRTFSTGRVLAGQRAHIPRMYLRRTLNGPRLAPPVVAASGAGHDDPDASMPTGHFWNDGEPRLCGLSPLASQRSTVTAEPLTDDRLAARLLPATIALRNHIGRGPYGWSRPISPNVRPPTSDRRASRERARARNRDKSGT